MKEKSSDSNKVFCESENARRDLKRISDESQTRLIVRILRREEQQRHDPWPDSPLQPSAGSRFDAQSVLFPLSLPFGSRRLNSSLDLRCKCLTFR